MKRILGLLLLLSVLTSLFSCRGNFTQIDLKKPIALPEGGIVEKALLEEIKKENAIATFKSSSNGIEYEWKIFGSEITDVKDINLSVTLEKSDECIKVLFDAEQELGFSAMLSIKLDEKWTAASATAYNGETPVCSVSITGNILNLSLDRTVAELLIKPNREEESVADSNRPSSDGSSIEQDKYLTDPVPEGKPLPVEPENQEINNGKAYTCTFSIECSTILNNLSELDPDKLECVPANGVILAPTTVTFYEGESVFDVL